MEFKSRRSKVVSQPLVLPSPIPDPQLLAPIGMFDSGVGGLSVLRELQTLLPAENWLYFADSGNCPYGTRPPAEIRTLTERVAAFLLAQGAKALVIACNTASTAAVAGLRQKWPSVPIVGMVPAVKPAAATTTTGCIGVLATAATGRAPALQSVIEQFAANIEVKIVAPPGLVELIEAGKINAPETEQLLRAYLAPLLAQRIDVLVLGCTHFPFLRPLLAKILGDGVQLVDSGAAVARQTRRVLEAAKLLNPESEKGHGEFFTSGDITKVQPVIAALLGDIAANINLKKIPLN